MILILLPLVNSGEESFSVFKETNESFFVWGEFSLGVWRTFNRFRLISSLEFGLPTRLNPSPFGFLYKSDLRYDSPRYEFFSKF